MGSHWMQETCMLTTVSGYDGYFQKPYESVRERKEENKVNEG